MILQQSEGTVTENKDNYVADVDTKINEEKERLAQHTDNLGSEQLMSNQTDPADALKILQRIKKDFDDSSAKINRYKQYQESLDIAP